MLKYCFLGRVCLFSIKMITNDICDRNTEMPSESKVSLVTARHRHDGPSSVSCQHIFCYPYRNLPSVKRIDGKGAGETACDLFYFRHPFTLTPAVYILQVFFDL